MVKPSLANPPQHKEISTIKQLQSSLRGHSQGPWHECYTNILCNNWICHVSRNSGWNRARIPVYVATMFTMKYGLRFWGHSNTGVTERELHNVADRYAVAVKKHSGA